ncbi:MAG: hypothetical protein AB8U25_03905 [Rickettsiales endosymbiont of Dermacentor nuttalli]
MPGNKRNIYDINWKNTDQAIKTLKKIIKSEERKSSIHKKKITLKQKNNSSERNDNSKGDSIHITSLPSDTSKYLGKSYVLQQSSCQPCTSTRFVNYVNAGERGNEIIGGLIKNGPYKGQFLFTESRSFTGTVIIPEYIKINNSISTVYPEESITFLNGKVYEIHPAKPSRLKIHRAHLKEERNNRFQRNKAIIHRFIVNDASLHNQEIHFLSNPTQYQMTETKPSVKYIISPDILLMQSIAEQQKGFLDKIPIIKTLLKSYYSYKIHKALVPENLVQHFIESPEKFHISVYAQNKNGHPIKIDLKNLYIYNNNFYNKLEHAIHSHDSYAYNLPTDIILSNNITVNTKPYTYWTKSLRNSISKIIIGFIPTLSVIGITISVIASQGIILPLLDSMLGITTLVNKQLLPDSSQVTMDESRKFTQYQNPNKLNDQNLGTTKTIMKNENICHNPKSTTNVDNNYFTNSVLTSNKQNRNERI